MISKDEIIMLYNSNKKGYMHHLKNNNELVNFLNAKYPNIAFNLQLINYLTGENHVCKFNNIKKFKSPTKYSFCSKNCKCEILHSNKKRKEKNISKYGVDNPMKLSTTKEKIKATNLKKYGVENPFQSEEIKKQIKATNLKKYGVDHHYKNKDFFEKIKKNNLEKYGVNFTVERPIIKEKIKATNLKKYGVENPFQSEEIKKQIKATNLKKYGNHITNIGQKHISEKNLEILNNKEKLQNILNKVKNVEKTAEILDVHLSSIYSRIKNFNLDVKLANTSFQEIEFKNFLSKNKINFKENDRSIITPYEIDFVLTDYNIGIELNGLYWHSENSGNKNHIYHLNKNQLAKNKNINLLQFYDCEWRNKKDIIKNIVLYKCKKNIIKIGARKCNLLEIDFKQANSFYERTHIQGATPLITKSYGLIYHDNLVSCISFLFKNNSWELTRFSSTCNVQGGFTKLLNHAVCTNNIIKITSFSDNRYSNGNLYNINGFTIKNVMKPTYYYTDYKNIFHRFNFRKKLIEKRFGLDMSSRTEKAAMLELGYDRIWDAGKICWIKEY